VNDEFQIRAFFMPKPNQGESKDEYLQRCMGDSEMQKYSQDQRYLLCNVYWKEVKLESYTDYPQAATENAKIALRWAEKNGWGTCGTPVGKQRANQLANREPISEDTISRMAAFERHRQNSKNELGDGCGRLMWLAWGGDEGIEWSQRKLKQIRNED
jgi:hypothetical protein